MGAVKNALKKILPPPVNSFMREVNRIVALEEKNQLLIHNLCVQIEQQEERIKRLEYIVHQTAKLEQENQELIALMPQIIEKQGQIQNKEIVSSEKTIIENLINLRDILWQKQDEQMGLYHHENIAKLSTCFEQMSINHQEIINLLTNTNDEAIVNFDAIQQTMKHIKDTMPYQKVYWNNGSERKFVKANWGDVATMTDFPEKFLNLTSGLDAESVDTVIKILKRQLLFLNNSDENIDLFTCDEQQQLRILHENFYSRILKISDDLYAYKNYLLPINHFEASVFYYEHGLNEIDDLNKIEGKSIIDVGGFIGDSILILSKLKPKDIYSFEAVPKHYELLKRTVELNHIENVYAENLALGAESGTATIHLYGGGSTLVDRADVTFKNDIEVPILTLDEYVASHPMEIGLIKVDIEGSEPDFLIGAKKTICEQKPILLISIYHNAHDFFELKPLIESWNLGYMFKIYKPTFENTTSEILLIAQIEE